MKTILFQGDSITDTGRNREDEKNLGVGYPYLIANRLGLERPEEFHFINKGINGNRIVDIYARMKIDIINLKPDVMTLLIGVNDVWHELAHKNGVDTVKFKKIYRMLLEELLEVLPELKIILIEPFVLKGTATAGHLEFFQTGVEERAQAVRELGKEFGLPVVSFQEDLNKLESKATEGYWLFDGVHPTGRFHQFMADKLLPVIVKETE